MIMRTNEERESMIRIRTREIKHNQRVKRRRILDVLVTVACITLVVSIGVLLPKLIYGVTEEHIIENIFGSSGITVGKKYLKPQSLCCFRGF